LNRARSAFGKGADMIHPPGKDESQADPFENPMIPSFPETL
jgi:hypothetical protein